LHTGAKLAYFGSLTEQAQLPRLSPYAIFSAKLHFCLGPVTRFANSTGARAGKLGQKHVMKQQKQKKEWL
jgi:hypothetical protein